MSFKVLVIPEDPTQNGYILKPLIQAVLTDASKPNAKVDVLTNPHVRGYSDALRVVKEDLPDRYRFFDLWIFMPDGDLASAEAMRALEGELRDKGVRLFCCPAQPEVEIYACCAFRGEIPGGWKGARSSTMMKEEVFEPLLKAHGDVRRPGGGRDLMIAASLSNMSSLYQLCPELAELRDRIKELAAA